MDESQGRSIPVCIDAPPLFVLQGSRVIASDHEILVRELDERPGFFKTLFILLRRKNSWSAAVIACEFYRFLTNIGTHREINKLFNLRPYAEIVQRNPGFAFKYLIPNYLARRFKVNERASCFLHHYRRMHDTLCGYAVRQILHGGVTLYGILKGGSHFAVKMGLPKPPFDKEGELSLDLQVNGDNVFNLSFTIIPGSVLKSEAAEILLITRLQGTPGCYPEIKLATKTLHEVGPSALLLAALQGIADALGIDEIAGVEATNQRSYCEASSSSLKSAYDDFFTELVMTRNAEGFFCSPVPIEHKPLASIKQGHKLRTKEKRAFKEHVRFACTTFFLKYLIRPPTSPCGPLR